MQSIGTIPDAYCWVTWSNTILAISYYAFRTRTWLKLEITLNLTKFTVNSIGFLVDVTNYCIELFVKVVDTQVTLHSSDTSLAQPTLYQLGGGEEKGLVWLHSTFFLGGGVDMASRHHMYNCTF